MLRVSEPVISASPCGTSWFIFIKIASLCCFRSERAYVGNFMCQIVFRSRPSHLHCRRAFSRISVISDHCVLLRDKSRHNFLDQLLRSFNQILFYIIYVFLSAFLLFICFMYHRFILNFNQYDCEALLIIYMLKGAIVNL